MAPKRKEPSQGENGVDGNSLRSTQIFGGLCQYCSTIGIQKIQKAFDRSRLVTNSQQLRIRLGKVIEAIHSEDYCKLCKFFVETLRLRTTDSSFRILDANFDDDIVLKVDTKPWFTEAGVSVDRESCPFVWLDIGNKTAQPSICISLEATAPTGEIASHTSDLVYPVERSALAAFNGSCHPHTILSWLEKCESKHNECHEERTLLPPDFLVIDVQSRELARLLSGEPFLTLSYVWGKGGMGQRYWLDALYNTSESDWHHFEGLKLPEVLPQTINDAIEITQQLKQKYLWVDLICIDQTDAISKQAQIEAMDVIFASSWLTLVCVDGTHADYGLTGASRYMSQTKQPKVSTPIGRLMATHVHSQWRHNGDSAHDQRAWTLQERLLSRRCLFFSDTYVSMVCQQELFHELLDINITCPNVVPWLSFERFREDGSEIDLDLPKWDFDTYGNLVSVYTSRNVTDEDDAYNACRGSLKRMTAKCGMEFHFGLPRDDLLQSLLWVPHHANIIQRRRGFASWSWLGWKGRSEYPYWLHHKNTAARPCEPSDSERRSMKKNMIKFDEENGRLEAVLFSDRTMTAPVIQLKTTVRRCNVALLYQSGTLCRPSRPSEVQTAIGDQ